MLPVIENHLKKRLNTVLPNHASNEIYHYALFPCGKLIRSQVVLALAQDISGNYNLNHLQVASFIEFHHAYSLVHDDLPCMDNDDFRRGKPSTHKAYNEWKALLIGDGLLVASFGELAEINSRHLKMILRFATQATGPQGLILGQIMDLNQEMNHSLELLIKTHKLKTARLFQLSLILSYYCSLPEKSSPQLKDIFFYYKLGNDLGIVFQLLDDLLDLAHENISPHESSINPFLKDCSQTTILLEKKMYSLRLGLNKKKHITLNKVLNDNYFTKMIVELQKSQEVLKIRIKNYLPIKLALDTFKL